MDLKALVQRLNPICFRALEQAAERSRAQGHWFVRAGAYAAGFTG
ncbi:T6SS protein Cts2V [Citrobacter freundii]|nr:T6SS protein Cts2V [Citrobacter freundii]